MKQPCYFIGGIPFLTYHEKDTMIVGLLDGSGGSSDTNPIPVPPVEQQPLPPESASGLINPLPGSTVTSEYGYRKIDVKGSSTFHEAIDLAYGVNDPRYPGQIIASGGGVIIDAGWAGGCGNMVRINHGNGLETGYCHMNTIYVEGGNSVVQGQVIGQVGTTGTSSGIHLHFIIYAKGKKVNPRKYVNF